MSSMAISLIALACIFGGMLLGMILRTLLPAHHLSEDTRDAVKLGIGMIATMAALVLSLMISSAKGAFDTLNSGLRNNGTKIILLDRAMARYGPETREARGILKDGVNTAIERIWPAEKKSVDVKMIGGQSMTNKFVELEEKLRELAPRNNDQRRLQSQALQFLGGIREGMFQLYEQVGQSSIPTPFLVLLVCWLTVIFFSIGLFTSPNTTVIVILFICAFSAASALYLILELDQPFGG